MPGDAQHTWDVFVHDRQTGTTERISTAPDGTRGNGDSFQPAISADGRWVAFISHARNLVPNDTNAQPDVFVHDRQTGKTERVSADYDGQQSNGWTSGTPALSAGGRWVAFWSQASNLVPNDTNSVGDVFVRDREHAAAAVTPATPSIQASVYHPDPQHLWNRLFRQF